MSKETSIDTFIKDGLKDQVQAMHNPGCVDCAECCSAGAVITDEEFERLSKYLKKNKYGRFLYERAVTTIWKHLKNGIIYWLCPFSYNKRCQIYNQRPAICRNFHCDKPNQELRHYKDSLQNTHAIADLFKKETFDLYAKLQKGKR